MPKNGKVFMQDKDDLLNLANVITSGKELDVRQKINKTKASALSIHVASRQRTGTGPKPGFPSVSDRLHAAKKILVARKARQKREKTRARKREGQETKKDAGSHGGNLGNHASPSPASRKRVSFALPAL